jgi:hypothetical protein
MVLLLQMIMLFQDIEGNVAIQLLDYDGNALEVDGKVFYRDKKSDVAIIKINPEEVGIKLKPISLETQEPNVVDKVMNYWECKGFWYRREKLLWSLTRSFN